MIMIIIIVILVVTIIIIITIMYEDIIVTFCFSYVLPKKPNRIFDLILIYSTFTYVHARFLIFTVDDWFHNF